MKIKIGADPEVFLFDEKKKHFVSAAGFFPGTKKAPFKVDKGAIQVDGIALEFNIDPAETEDQFVTNIKTVHSVMESMVKDVNPDWTIFHTPIVEILPEVWEKVPAEARELGCDPDFNVYGAPNPNPSEAIEDYAKRLKVAAVRTGSGHIHIGWSEGENPEDIAHFEDCRACSSFFQTHQPFQYIEGPESYKRLTFYGGMGAFRPKSYGVELRSPSNYWVKSEQSIRTAFRATKSTFDKFVTHSGVY